MPSSSVSEPSGDTRYISNQEMLEGKARRSRLQQSRANFSSLSQSQSQSQSPPLSPLTNCSILFFASPAFLRGPYPRHLTASISEFHVDLPFSGSKSVPEICQPFLRRYVTQEVKAANTEQNAPNRSVTLPEHLDGLDPLDLPGMYAVRV